MPSHEHFICLTLLIISMTFVLSLTRNVGLRYILVCDVEHTFLHFGPCGREFVLCLFGQCPGLCTICLCCIPVSSGRWHMVAFEDIPVFGGCPSACNDYSLYLFVLVLFLEAVVLSQAYVAFNIFYQQIVNVYWGPVYNHHVCL